MLRAAQPVPEHLIGEPAALAHLAHADDARHEGEVGVDQAKPLARRAGALRVRAEERRLDAIGRCERLADRIQDAGVRGRVRSTRAADGRLVDDRDRRIGARQAAVDERALAGAGDAGDGDEHAGRHVNRHVLEVVQPGVPDRDRAGRRPHRRLHLLLDVQVLAGQRAGSGEAGNGPSYTTDRHATRRRAHVDHVVGDADDLRVVLDDEDGVALVAQPLEEVVHLLYVVRVEADGRLVEDVGHIGQRRAEVADHLRALRLAARQRRGLAVEAQVPEADLDERVERCPQRFDDRRRPRIVDAAQERRRGR